MFSHWQGIEVCSKGIRASVGLSSRLTPPWTPLGCVLIILFPVLTALSSSEWERMENQRRTRKFYPRGALKGKGTSRWFSASVLLMVLKRCWSSQPHFLLLLSHAMNDKQQQASKQKKKTSDDNRLVDRSLARPARRLQRLEARFPASAVCWLGWLRLFGG